MFPSGIMYKSKPKPILFCPNTTNTSITEQYGKQINQKSANKLLLLCPIKIVITAELPFAGQALKVPEPYAVKVARTVLWGRKLPG